MSLIPLSFSYLLERLFLSQKGLSLLKKRILCKIFFIVKKDVIIYFSNFPNFQNQKRDSAYSERSKSKVWTLFTELRTIEGRFGGSHLPFLSLGSSLRVFNTKTLASLLFDRYFLTFFGSASSLYLNISILGLFSTIYTFWIHWSFSYHGWFWRMIAF